MKFSDFILPDAIITDLVATDKEGVIREMVRSLLDANGIVDSKYEEIVDAILRREELGSTGIGRGIAVPHTKHQSVNRLVGTVAISPFGVDFDSLDGECVNLLFLLISPPDKPGEHLRALEHITRQLRDDAFCRYLKASKTREDVISLLEEEDDPEAPRD